MFSFILLLKFLFEVYSFGFYTYFYFGKEEREQSYHNNLRLKIC